MQKKVVNVIDRKGVSEVIVSVLMILLVIAAVAIFWVAISKFLEGRVSDIETGINLVSIDITNNVVSEADGKAFITIKRDVSGGNLSEIKFLFDTSNGNQYSVIKDVLIQELEMKQIEVILPTTMPAGSYITKITAVPGVKVNGRDRFSSTGVAEATRGSPTNLLTNGDMEDWDVSLPIGYSAVYRGTASKTATKYSGTYAALITYSALPSPAPSTGIYKFINTSTSSGGSDLYLTIGQQYSMSAWILCPSAQGNKANMLFQCNLSTQNSLFINCDDKWHYHTFKWTASTPDCRGGLYPGEILKIAGGNLNPGDYVIVDDAQIYASI